MKPQQHLLLFRVFTTDSSDHAVLDSATDDVRTTPSDAMSLKAASSDFGSIKNIRARVAPIIVHNVRAN